MLSQIYPQIYCNQIPLPNNPLKYLNSYILVSPDRNLIIDTGFNQPECEAALVAGITELGLDLTKTDVLLTHRHSDHAGLAGLLEQRGAHIYVGAKERESIQEMFNPDFWTGMDNLMIQYGLGEYDITVNNHPGFRYRSQAISHCDSLSEGATLRYGDYTFSVIDIPGHTPGQIGLYEAKHHLFFCGDHILDSITPNITFWGFEQDSLAQYLDSLRKVATLSIDWLFTGHREIIRDPGTRINQLINHHAIRLAETLHILEKGSQSAAQVAARMKWEIRAKSWEDFPKAQKWFATGEAAAHLEYLFNTGRISRENVDGTLHYYKESEEGKP